jgi:hypothetical protein
MGCSDNALIEEPYVYKNRVQDLILKLGSILVGTRSMKLRACTVDELPFWNTLRAQL